MSDTTAPEAPYLPPAEPADNPAAPPARSARKTLLLWVALIVMFLGIYHFLTPSQRTAQGRRHAPARYEAADEEMSVGAPTVRAETAKAGVGWVSMAPLGLSLLLIGGFIALVRKQVRGGNRFNLAQEEGHLALASGDAAGAARAYTALLDQYRGQLNYAAVARYNLGRALLQQGLLEAARDQLIQVERTPGLLYGAEVRLLAGVQLAEVYALLGELDAASRWITDCRRRLSRCGNRIYAAAVLRVAEALVCCRQDRFGEARDLLDRDLRRIEAALTVQGMRPVWLLRAFVAAQLAGPRDAGEAAPWLAHLRPGRPGEFAPWVQRWPALRAFVAAHLDATAAA